MIRLFLLLFLVSSSDQLACISQTNIYLSENLLNIEELHKVIRPLQPIDNHLKECRVELTFDHTKHSLNILFNSTVHTGGKTPVGYPRLITTFTLDSHLSTIIDVLIYACKMNDGCDRDFVLYQSFWLSEQNYVELQIKFTNLLIKEKTQSVHCIEGSSKTDPIKCSNGICSAATGYSENNPKPGYTGGCASKSRNSTSVRITTTNSNSYLTNVMFYTCMFDKCNDANTVYNVIDAALKLYNVSNLIHWRSFKNQTISNITTTKSWNQSFTSLLTNPSIVTFLNETRLTTSNQIIAHEITSMMTETTITDHIKETTTLINNAALFTYPKSTVIMKMTLSFFLVVLFA